MAKSLSEIPVRKVSLGQAGVDRLMRRLQRQPALIDQTIRALHEDPRGTIEHIFRLSKSQRTMLHAMTAERLQKLVSPLIQAGTSLSTRRVIIGPDSARSEGSFAVSIASD